MNPFRTNFDVLVPAMLLAICLMLWAVSYSTGSMVIISTPRKAIVVEQLLGVFTIRLETSTVDRGTGGAFVRNNPVAPDTEINTDSFDHYSDGFGVAITRSHVSVRQVQWSSVAMSYGYPTAVLTLWIAQALWRRAAWRRKHLTLQAISRSESTCILSKGVVSY